MSEGQAHRQDYICKVRYQNDLPPPPCPPKLLKYTTFDPKSSLSDTGLLSALFRKENFKNLLPLNLDLGMPLDLLKIPGLIENNNEQNLLGFKNKFELHPDDLLLLVDPLYANTAKSQPVSFLRRTQYIAERSSSPSSSSQQSSTTTDKLKSQSASSLLLKKRKSDEEVDSTSQVRAVEATFEKAQELEELELSKIKHPTKRNLKLKKIWNFLPDVALIDKNFISLKFNGSASVTRSLPKDGELPENFKTTIFRPVNTEHGEEWVSLFTATNPVSEEVKSKLDDTKENIPIDEASILDEVTTKYVFNRSRDYDMIFKKFEFEKELALNFDKESNTSFFAPINGKIDLKRRRITPSLERIVKENTIDRLEINIREPTTSEAIKRDNARSRYDPINYIEHEEEEEEEEEEEIPVDESFADNDTKIDDNKQDSGEDSKTDEGDQ